jgi:hypothetical protein
MAIASSVPVSASMMTFMIVTRYIFTAISLATKSSTCFDSSMRSKAVVLLIHIPATKISGYVS